MCNGALKSSGFTEQLKFHESKAKKPRKSRSRNTIWFNPPYSKTVETNVGKHFLNLVDKHFPRSCFLRKIINRKNVKVSYSCMPNIRCIINQHNAKILGSTDEPSLNTCNCRKKSDCPLDGACLERNVVYNATITADNGDTKSYIGMTEKEFKTRYRNHKTSFSNRKYASATALSKYVWVLKDANINYSIKWSIVKRARAYTSGAKHCNLCLAEKLCILKANKGILNKRSELLAK